MEIIKNIQTYLLHFLAGFFIAILFQFDWAVAVTAVVIIGTGKEFYDKYVKETFFDWMDVACTALGGLVGFGVWVIYK